MGDPGECQASHAFPALPFNTFKPGYEHCADFRTVSERHLTSLTVFQRHDWRMGVSANKEYHRRSNATTSFTEACLT